MNTQPEEKLKVLPEIPKEFGEDGGRFYKYYDTLAEEIDEDMVKSLKSQLDGILIFAGLFAGVNSAFLALTLPEMSADPADDTNALLLQLVTGGNGSIHSAGDLPSASFSPTSSIIPINILFSLSLTLALLAAFLAVLGQQWLMYYRKRSGGGAEAQRWEQLRRYLGAKRWRLEAILDDILPSLLQLGLVIFCISFVLYLGTLSGPMCYTVAVPIGLALVCIVWMAVCAAYDHWCPFKSPLSHLVQFTSRLVRRPVLVLLYWVPVLFQKSLPFTMWPMLFCFVLGPGPILIVGRLIHGIIRRATHWLSEGGSTSEVGQHAIITATRSAIRSCTSRTRTTFWIAVESISYVTRAPIYPSERREGMRAPEFKFGSIASWVACSFARRAESVDRLKSMAAKRVICTSEDRNALIYAAVNLQAVTSEREASWLLSDGEFYSRLSKPWRCHPSTFDRMRHPDPRAMEMVAFSNSLLHLIPSSSSLAFIVHPDERTSVPFHRSDEYPGNKQLHDILERIGDVVNEITNLGVESSCPHCTQCMMSSLLCILLRDPSSQVKMDNWFEQFSTSLAHSTQDEAALATHLLAWAVEAYMAREIRRIPMEDTRGRTIWHVVYKMERIYHGRDVGVAVGEALKVFPSVDSPSRPSDGVCVMLLERVCASLDPYFGSTEQLKLIAKHATDLFQSIIHQETRNQLSKHPEKDLVARCINLIVWNFVHAGRYETYHEDLVIAFSTELKVCLKSAEQISTRKSSTVDVPAFLNLLRIRDTLVSPAKYAEWATRYTFRGDAEISKYNSVYDELVTCFARLESAVLAVQRTTDPVMANPADPLPVRVVDGEDEPGGNAADGENPPGGKFSCHLFL